MKLKLRPFFWKTVVLITNIAGLLVYFMYKYGNNVCPACGAHISKNDKFCSGCGKKIDM